MASRRSEYEVEDIFIERLEGIGYQFIKMSNYDDVLNNFEHSLLNLMQRSWKKQDIQQRFLMQNFKES